MAREDTATAAAQARQNALAPPSADRERALDGLGFAAEGCGKYLTAVARILDCLKTAAESEDFDTVMLVQNNAREVYESKIGTDGAAFLTVLAKAVQAFETSN